MIRFLFYVVGLLSLCLKGKVDANLFSAPLGTVRGLFSRVFRLGGDSKNRPLDNSKRILNEADWRIQEIELIYNSLTWNHQVYTSFLNSLYNIEYIYI